jgi:hypothetical protein
MKNVGGRPPLPMSFSLMLWAFVELMRDREDGGERRAVRAACRLTQQQFSDDLKGGRFLTVDTIRRHHADTERAMRDDADKRALAIGLLDYGRRRRKLIGWNASLWLHLIDPARFIDSGYETDVNADFDDAIVLSDRRK